MTWRFSLWSKLKFHMIKRRIKPSCIEFERLKVYYCFYFLERERERFSFEIEKCWDLEREREREREKLDLLRRIQKKKMTVALTKRQRTWFSLVLIGLGFSNDAVLPDLLCFSSLINWRLHLVDGGTWRCFLCIFLPRWLCNVRPRFNLFLSILFFF
jgi:hypothetical protein